MLPLVIIADLWSIVLKMFLGFLDIYIIIHALYFQSDYVTQWWAPEPIQSNGKDFGFGAWHI